MELVNVFGVPGCDLKGIFGMAPSPDQISGIIITILAIGCVGFCVIGGLVFLVYRFAYKESKQNPPHQATMKMLGSKTKKALYG